MKPAKWLIPLVCASTSLLAQSTNDLNGLVSVAAHYVSSGVAGTHTPMVLSLNKIVGDNGSGTPEFLMTKATDVQHWTFLYRTNAARPEDASPDAKPKLHPTAQAECSLGVFKNFHFSDKPITGTKSLEDTWVAVSLDNAILNLNANGYIRGFSGVSMQRPDLPNWPDEYVYVFTCPWERRKVAISCQTGALTWSYGY